MKLVCPNCGYRTEAELHSENCPKCKAPMQEVREDKNKDKKTATK